MKLNNLVNEIKVTLEKMISTLGENHSGYVTYNEVQRLSGLDAKTIKEMIKITTDADIDIDKDWNKAIRTANKEVFYKNRQF